MRWTIDLYIPKGLLLYLRKCQDICLEAALLVLITGILCVASFYVFDMMWHLYLETQMGQRFVVMFHEETKTVAALLSLDHLFFSCWLTLATFVICLSIAAISQFLHISRYLYCSQGICGKLLFWALPLSAAVAYFIKMQYRFENFEIIFFVTLLPTICLFTGTFRYTRELLPELGDVIRHSFPFSKRAWKKLLELRTYLVELWGRL